MVKKTKETNKLTVIKDLLNYALEKNASDLHLSVGSIPMVRIDGKMNKLNLPEMILANMEKIVFVNVF